MEAQSPESGDEAARLRRCLNDLVSIMALPALWAGGEPQQIVSTMLDALVGMLRLTFAFVRLNDPNGGPSIEMMRVAERAGGLAQTRDVAEALDASLGEVALKWPRSARVSIGDAALSVACARLGFDGDIGVLAAGSRALDFPNQVEALLLDVAANQAAIGLQQARLLSEQKRVSRELDERVAQRTRELEAANDELRRSEAFLAEGQHLARLGSFSWRVDDDRITWSDQLYRIFEFEPGSLVTLDRLGTRVHPEDVPLLNGMIDRARDAASNFEYEHRLLMPDNSVRHLHLIAHATRDEKGRLEYFGAVQDVTERRLAEAALSHARSELARVAGVTSLGVLTASIAHEVNQPLSGIVTNASTCLRMLAADPPNVDGARETARRTIRDGNRASEVVARLRALFSGRGAAIESVELNDAAREVIALSLSDLQRNRVILRTEFREDLPPVSGDRVQLQQVILNLIRNAADAMSSVDDRPRQLLVRTELDEEDRVRLTVQDSGAGFRPETSARLFEAFYTTKNGGMGIGLSVSRSIIENHSGRLWAVANDGPGATFSFSVPRRTQGATNAA
jgi:C4-dicarboxylate-specific signal transduction histidine kinase